MRKLGHGHSVMFFASPAVDRSIRAVVSNTDTTSSVTTGNILCWAIHETLDDIQQRAPYWAQQGMNHRSRYNAWSHFFNGEFTREQLSDAWLQPDLKSMSDLYAPCSAENATNDLSALDSDIRQRCKDLGVLSLPSARLNEEQEREVHRERERERQVELPPWARPKKHHLHPAVVEFVKTGVIPPLYTSSAFRPVFGSLERISGVTHWNEVGNWSPLILATVDFCETIDPGSTQVTMNQYLRPVQWTLSGEKGRDKVLVLLSPFEADTLMPEIRASQRVHLHVYAPRTSQRMKPSDDLRLYSTPPLPSDWTPPWALIDQLNVFAGQLYLTDYDSYLRLCRLLGIPAARESGSGPTVKCNLSHIREITSWGSTLPFVKAVLAIRSRGQPFAHTHMGKILQGQLLTEKDFQGSRSFIFSDTQNDPASGSSTLLPSSKRGVEMAGISNADSESPQGRMPVDGVTSGSTPPSRSSHAEEEPGSSVVLRPSKRGLETVDAFDAECSEPPQKRFRED